MFWHVKHMWPASTPLVPRSYLLLTQFQVQIKVFVAGLLSSGSCSRAPWSGAFGKRKNNRRRCLHSCLNPKVYSSLLMSPPRLRFTIYPLVQPPSSSDREGLSSGTPRSHITLAHTHKKKWPASCRLGEAVFTVTPFWRRGLIPLLSGAAYVCVNLCVCVCVCVCACTHMCFYTCLCLCLLSVWTTLVAVPEIKLVCALMCNLCALSPTGWLDELDVYSVHTEWERTLHFFCRLLNSI